MQSQILPTLLRVEDFANQAGLSLHQAYDMARKMPPGVIIKLGRRVRLDADRLTAWLASGGTLA